jgi:predicted PurR-regulated permease PerM
MNNREIVWQYLRRVAIALVVIFLAWRLRQTIQLLSISVFIAAAITPLVEQMEQRRIRRGFAVGIIYAGLLLVILTTVAPAPQLIAELAQFFTKLPELALKIHIPNLSFLGISQQQLYDIAQPKIVIDQLQGVGRDIAGQTVEFTFKLVNALGISLLSLLITGYMVVNAKELIRKCLSPFSPEIRQEVLILIPPINRCVGAYVLGRIGTSALLGFCTYLAITLLKVPYSGALGLLVAVSNLIPFVGPFLGLIPMVISAWSLGFVVVGLVIGISFTLQQIEAWVLQPWLVGPYLNLDPFELLLSIIIGAELLGVVGALISPPVAGVGRIIFNHFYAKHLLSKQETSDEVSNELEDAEILRSDSDLESRMLDRD